MNEEILKALTRIANSLENIERELVEIPDNKKDPSYEEEDLIDAWFKENLLI